MFALLCSALALLWTAQGAWPAAGFPFLRISAGARSASLAEAVTAVTDADPFAINPATLESQAGRYLGFSHSEWIQDIGHDEVSATSRFGSTDIGVAAQLFRADGLESRVGPTRDSLGDFGVYEWAVGVSAARDLGLHLRCGVAFKLVRQSIFADAAGGGALDFGLLYRLSELWRLGMAVRNLGTVSRLDRESTDLPRQLRVGATCDLTDRLMLSADSQHNEGSESTSVHIGVQWHSVERLTLRGGYQTAENRSVSAGFGLALDRWLVDYAYLPFESDLGAAHRFSIQVSPGGGGAR